MSIALTTHKVAAVAVGVAMVFSFAFVTPAQAQTVEELTAQINSLLATISSLQAQLAGMTGGTTGGSSACYNFTLNHSTGDQGGEVMNIQKFLNAQGNLVATTGAGSPGNETSYFGSRTAAAVTAWQNANAAAVLAPVGLSAGTGYWGPSSRAHANTVGCTTTPGTNPTVPTGTGVSVSAAAQPANGLAPESAARVPFTKFTVTNNSGSAQTIDSVTVQRGGVASNLSFDGVLLLDQNGVQLGNAKVLNSNDQATIGSSVTLNPGESRTFTVAANMEAVLDARAGEVATFSVVAINTSATVSGSLPITGAAHTINATLAIGSVSGIRGSEDPNAASTEEVGTTNYTFTAIRLTAGSAENVRLHSIRFDMSGSASASDLANVRAIIDGVEYTPMVDGDVYTFTFGSGIVINEGLNKEIAVKGDIVGGTNRTIAFDIEEFTDIHVTGETYGYGITVTDGGAGFTTTEPVYDANVVTIEAGSFNSVSRSNAAPAANIGVQNSDETLGAFTMDLKGESINVQTMNFDITVDAGSTSRQITNVTLVDQNGAVLAGPVDSSVLTTSGGTNTDALTFSSVDLPVGVTTVFVRGQLDSNWANNDTLAISTAPSTDWSDAQGNSTGDSVTLPTATATANTMTVKSAALSATTLAASPATRSIVAGANDYVFATITLDASNSGENIKVTGLVLEDTLGDAGDDAGDIDNVEIWANLSGGTTNDSVRGDQYETRVADAEQFSDTGASDETLSITLDTHITVNKNSSVDIAVVADLASGATTGDTHTISLDTDAGDVTAVGLTSGTSVSVTPTGSGQTQTVAGGGTLTTSVDSSSPVASLLLDDTVNEQTVAVFRLAASNVEDLDVDSLLFTSGNTAVQKYVFYDGSTKLGEKTNAGSPEFFLSDGQLVIPANGHKLVTVKAVMRDVDGTTVANGAAVAVVLDNAETTGVSSGGAVDSGTNRTAATHNVYEAYPMFAFNNDGVSTVLTQNANHLIAKVVITNSGSEDVTFSSDGGGDDDVLSIQVQVVGDDTDTGNETLTLKDEDGLTLDTGTINSATGVTQIDFTTWTNTLTVPAGGSETVSIFGDTSDLEDDGDTIQIWLDDTAADVTFSVDSDAGNYTEGDVVLRGDIFGPTHVNPS